MEAALRLYDLVIVFCIFVVLVVMAVSVGVFIVMAAVLMPSVVFVVPCIGVEGLQRRLSHDEPTVIIGVIVLAHHPAAVVALVYH